MSRQRSLWQLLNACATIFVLPLAVLAQEPSGPTNWVNDNQAFVLWLRDIESTVDDLERLPIIEMAHTQEILDSLNSPRFRELWSKENGAVEPDVLMQFWGTVKESRVRRGYLMCDAEDRLEDGWVIFLQLPETGADSLLDMLENAQSDEADAKQPSRDSVHRVSADLDLAWFVHGEWLTIAASESKAEKVLSGVKGERISTMTFDNNRKWQATRELAEKYSSSDLIFYVDPSALNRQQSAFDPALWRKLGLDDLLSVSGVISIADNLDESNAQAIGQMTCLFRIASPRDGIWKLVGGTRLLPRLPKFPAHAIEGITVSFDPSATWEHASDTINDIAGQGMRSRIEDETSSFFGKPLEEILVALNGLYCNVGLAGNETRPGTFFVLFGVQDQAMARYVTGAMASKNLPTEKAQEDIIISGVTSWFEEQASFEEKRLRAFRLEKRQDQNQGVTERERQFLTSSAKNIGYACSDEFIFIGNQAIAEEMFQDDDRFDISRCHDSLTTPLSELRALGQAQKPFASGFMREESLQSITLSLIRSFEISRQQRNGGGFDLRDVELQPIKLDECQSLEEWTDQAIIRLMMSIAEVTDVGVVEAYDEGIGIRVSAGLYSRRDE